MLLTAIGVLSLVVWIYLVFARGGFWLARERDDRDAPVEPAAWPAVTAVVPARNEADVIAAAMTGLLGQDYPGLFRVILVDDQSSDGTAEVALVAARALGAEDRLQVIDGKLLPKGWTGKLWALAQGVEQASAAVPPPAYVLLTDADIGHAPGNLRALAARAEAGRLALAAQMVKLHCTTTAETLLIPAFVFFFQMLFPFAWVNDPRRRTAAGAGGCMLVRREALDAAGGIASVRAEIIDDCALAARLKRQGPIWLGLTEQAQSLRPYPSIGEIGRMISRSAYAQLDYSPWKLAGAVVGMAVTYLAPPILVLVGDGAAWFTGAGAWFLMWLAFQPTLRLYGRSPLWGLALPLIGAIYTWFTLQSAVQVWQGRGGQWKGRSQAIVGPA